MKTKKIVTSLMSLMMATTLIFSMVGCETKKDEKKMVDAPKKMTTEILFSKMEENRYINDAVIDQLFDDGILSGSEIKTLLEKAPSFEGKTGVDFDGLATIKSGNVSYDMSGAIAGGVGFAYDNKTQSARADVDANYKYNIQGEDVANSIKTSIYLVNEDGTYYAYTVDEDGATREEGGTLDEFYATDYDLNEVAEKFGLNSVDELKDMFKSYTKNIDTSKFELSDELVDKNGNKCYVLTANINGKEVFEMAKKSDAYKQALDEGNYSETEFEEMLNTELVDGYTINDLINDINYTITYYVDSNDFYITYADVDMKDCIEKLSNKLIAIYMNEQMSAYSDGENQIDTSVSVTLNKANLFVSFVKKDVTIKYDGEYTDGSILESSLGQYNIEDITSTFGE